MADVIFRALLNMFIFLLLFARLRVLDVTIYSASVVEVSTSSKSGFLRSDERFELEFVSNCSKPAVLNLARSLGFNRTSAAIIRWTKHGQTTLAVPGHDPSVELLLLWIFQSILAQFVTKFQ